MRDCNKYSLDAAELINGVNSLMARAGFYRVEDLSEAIESLRRQLEYSDESFEREFVYAVIALFEANIRDRPANCKQ